ncbi:hypothetical protein [Neptuniibacter sp. QD34_54]|uniref:hypothetical protein n=1 Tax=Neptuniibacter sp. QD34_54 TaxID=3398208 RepID=UPI0039F5AEA9
MYKLLITLLITTLPSAAFAHCAAQADDALEKLRNAQDSINDAYDLYDAGEYDRARTKAVRAKDKIWEGQVVFEAMRDRGVCDWEGPSLSEVNEIIGYTKISQDQARCVVFLSHMDKSRAALNNIYKSVTAEDRQKYTNLVLKNGKKALGVCEDRLHKYINKTITYHKS